MENTYIYIDMNEAEEKKKMKQGRKKESYKSWKTRKISLDLWIN